MSSLKILYIGTALAAKTIKGIIKQTIECLKFWV